MLIRRFALFPLLLLVSGACEACSCSSREGTVAQIVAQDFADNGVVAVFEVVGRERVRRDSAGKVLRGPWAVLVSHQVFKGSFYASQRQYALLPDEDNSCAANPRKGDLLLVYARDENSIRLGGCSSSGPLVGKLEEVAELFNLLKANDQ